MDLQFRISAQTVTISFSFFSQGKDTHLLIFKFFYIFLNFTYFFIQQVLISHPFYTQQCIHVNPNRLIHHTTTAPRHRFPPLVSIRLFSTSVSLFLPCKPVHLYHFSRFHIYALIYDIYSNCNYFFK